MNKTSPLLKRHLIIAESAKNLLWGGSSIQKRQLCVKGILAGDLGFVAGLFSGVSGDFRGRGGEVLKVSFQSLIELYEYLTCQVIAVSRKVVELSRREKDRKRVQLLRSVPGIGILIGMEILVEIQDLARFKRAEELASYIGLTPSEFSTGQYVRQGRITRSGSWRLRSALVESSWILIARERWIRMIYMSLGGRAWPVEGAIKCHQNQGDLLRPL
jgi:transposase